MLASALAALPMTTSSAMAQPSAFNSQCGEECLKGVMDQYLDAVLAHDSTKLPLAASYKATYNGRQTRFSEDYWAQTDEFPYRQYVYDTASGQVAFFGVSREGRTRGSASIRIKVSGGKITELEQLIGEQRVDNLMSMVSPNPLIDMKLTRQQQRSREELAGVVRAYFQALEDHDGSKLSVAPDCRRFDAGVQTSLNPLARLPQRCNEKFELVTYMDAVTERRTPMVDVERGIVVSFGIIKVSKPPQRVPGENPNANTSTGTTMSLNQMFAKPHDTLGMGFFKIIDGRIVEFHGYRRDMPLNWGSGW